MKTAPYISDVNTTPGIHPFVQKWVPKRITKIYKEYSIGQYTMVFVYTAIAMGLAVATYVILYPFFYSPIP